jgi:hypothetical protein
MRAVAERPMSGHGAEQPLAASADGPLSGVKQTPLWQPPETAFNPLQMCTAVARNTPTSDLSSVLVGFVIQRFRQRFGQSKYQKCGNEQMQDEGGRKGQPPRPAIILYFIPHLDPHGMRHCRHLASVSP